MNDTNLIILMGQIPASFRGSPQALANLMIKRMKIVSPSGANFIFVGDTEPTSDVGPWLKDGNKWYVFDDELKRYVPQDISDSETDWFQTGKNPPPTADPPVWLKTDRDATAEDPSIGNPISWHVHNGSNWVPFSGIVLSGPTTSRPSAPVGYQQYFDTTAGCLIWWAPDASSQFGWRTVDGVSGDIKPVVHQVLSVALERNPGWSVFGSTNSNLRGRYFSQATKDAGTSPETVLSVAAGVAERAAFETYGEATNLDLSDGGGSTVFPPTVAVWWLTKD
jgi:hypothetical protein